MLLTGAVCAFRPSRISPAREEKKSEKTQGDVLLVGTGSDILEVGSYR